MFRRGKQVTHSIGRKFKGWSGRRGARGCALVFICAGLALTLGVVARSAASSAPSFAGARHYRTGEFPVSIAIGDLNGDGKLDLATANYEGGTVSVFLNKGDGRFEPKRSYVVSDVGSGPRSLAIGDLNGDGKSDIAVGNPERAISVSLLLNRGDGRFLVKRDHLAGGSSVSIGDLNGDGALDLVTNGGSNKVFVHLNRGDGSFQARRAYRNGGWSDGDSESVAIGDVNGDGKRDLVIANTTRNTVSVLLNKGDGSFGVKLHHYRTGISPVSVAIGDLNGDHKPDLATVSSTTLEPDTVSWLLNKGDGSFGAKRQYRTDVPSSVAIGDLTGDGRPDLAIGSLASAASVFVNKGRGRFQPELDYAVGSAPTSVAIGDLNGDGKADLATANREDDTATVLLNKPGLCTVQSITAQRLSAAKRTLARANCRVGKIRRVLSGLRRGRVITQKPAFGAVLPGGSRVNLVVSLGRKH